MASRELDGRGSGGGRGNPGPGGWGNGGGTARTAPEVPPIDAAVGRGLSAAFGTRRVDTQRAEPNPWGPAGPFHGSTSQRGSRGYLIDVTFIALQR